MENGTVSNERRAEEVNNRITAGWFAGSMVFIMLMFAVFRWARFLFLRSNKDSEQSILLRSSVACVRRARSILLKAVPGFTSTGHAIVVMIYGIISIVICFVRVPYSNALDGFANRTGWLSFLNLALITFFALRYSPLSFLTGYSYERLIVLHRIAGYATIFWAVVHTVVFTVSLGQRHWLWHLYKERPVVFGDVATLAMLVILGTAIVLDRMPHRMPYEAFYMIHIVLFVVILVTLCLHPKGPMALGSILVVICTAAFWVVDCLVRLLQLFRYSVGNEATLSPLPNGGIRIVMRKSPKGLVGGAHCSLWIPSIRLFETHPLAILSTNPLEFVLASYDGFTGALYKASLQKTTVWASVHGPYGASLDFSGYDKVVFIAGGSGASFTFALATELLRNSNLSTKPIIEFVWVVRQEGCISWYAKELEQLASSPLVRLTIHRTTVMDAASKSHPQTDQVSMVPTPPTAASPGRDAEKNSISGTELEVHRTWKTQPGRPDIVKIIETAVAEADPKDRLAVAACGPEELMYTARQTVSRNIKPEGPSLELQCEEYSW